MRIDTVLFDLDNTLLNRREAFVVFAERFIGKFIHLSNESEKEEIIHYLVAADRDGYRKKRELYEEALTSLRFNEPAPTVEQLLEYWFSEFFQCSVLMDGAIEILDALKAKGIKLGLITNGDIYAQNSKIDQVNIRSYFDAIIISDEVGMKKPDKRIFELALNELKSNQENTIFVGDQPINDIAGAEAAGIRGIWLAGFSEWTIPDREPTHTIQNLQQLIPLVEELAS